MLRKKIEEVKHKSELKKTGKKLVELIKLNDEDSHNAALKIIEEHQNDPEVINYQKRGQDSPLILACAAGKNKIAKRLLATKCVDVNAKGVKGTHALETALNDKNHKMTLLLAADQRVLINEPGSEGVPPIFIALGTTAKIKFRLDYPIEIVQAMLTRNDFDFKCRYVHHKRDIILGEHKYESKTVLHALMEALRSYYTQGGFCSFEYAGEKEKLNKHNFDVGRQLLNDLLVSGKVDLNQFAEEYTERSEKMKTALMIAVENSDADLVEKLLAAGANIHLRDNEGHSALQLAKRIVANKSHLAGNKHEPAARIVEMLKQAKLKESVAASPAAMFAPQPVAEYLVPPPRPSAPPEEEVLGDQGCLSAVIPRAGAG